MKKIVIIGHGPAGISAAIYLKRSGHHPIVIGKDYGAFSYDDIPIENYYGFSKPITGKKLIENGVAQAERLGIEIVYDSVIDIKPILYDRYEVITEKHQYDAAVVLLATGKRRLKLSIPGFKRLRGKGISFCATCDGFFYRKKKIAIIGCGSYMQHELQHLENLTDDITVFTNDHELAVPVNHKVVTSKIVSFSGDTKLETIDTENGPYNVDGAFIAIGTPSSVDFAQKLGVIVESNSLLVNDNYETNVPGLFAAGDVIGGKLQIAKAVYDGMMAAESIKNYLNKEKL